MINSKSSDGTVISIAASVGRRLDRLLGLEQFEIERERGVGRHGKAAERDGQFEDHVAGGFHARLGHGNPVVAELHVGLSLGRVGDHQLKAFRP